jgi:putative oxidoreductase
VNLQNSLARVVEGAAAILNPMQPLFALGLRVYVGWQFFKSGMVKLQDWGSTLFLFQEEYHVPLLPPGVAAVVGTIGEIAFPVLLWLGLCTRLAAIGLSAVNIMAVVAYAHVLLSAGFEGALGQHLLWGLMLLVTVIYGPGRLSVDELILMPGNGARRPA